MGDARDMYGQARKRAALRTDDVYLMDADAGTTAYSDTLLSVVRDFKNGGCPDGANAQSMAGKSKHGTVACRLFAVVNPKTQVIERAGFKTHGCLAMTGCASAACSLMEGRTLEDALAIEPADIYSALDGVPSGKTNTLFFATCAICGVVGDFLISQGATLEELDAVVPCNANSVSCLICEHCSLRDARIEMALAQDEERAERERIERRALAAVFDDARECSAASRLATPARWAELGIIPEHMTAEDLEMLVYDYLQDRQAECGDQETETEEPPVDSANIALLMGAKSYYLYDSSVMTDAYAHWAFLAAEDNPLATFADCVREESRLYPRPMAAASLGNKPFNMSADAIQTVWEEACAHPDYADIRRTEASNGAVYFYSTDYLTEARAKALAEWSAVERFRNV